VQGLGDDAIAGAHDEFPRRPAQVTPVVGIGCVSEDAVVLFVEGVHCSPRSGDPAGQDRCVWREPGVLPGRAFAAPLPRLDREPARLAEVAVGRRAASGLEDIAGHFSVGEMGHRVAAGLV